MHRVAHFMWKQHHQVVGMTKYGNSLAVCDSTDDNQDSF
jgi:hypothetical protein